MLKRGIVPKVVFVFHTHAEEVEYLKNWLFERINLMNVNLYSCY